VVLKYVVPLPETVFFGHCPSSIFNKITTFRKLDLLPSSGPGSVLRLAQPEDPTARVSVLLPFYLKTEEDPASEM
jgi:hypothetical protein